MRTILLTLLLSVAAISSFAQTNTYRECTSQNFKIISYTRELSPQGCQQSPIYVKPKRRNTKYDWCLNIISRIRIQCILLGLFY